MSALAEFLEWDSWFFGVRVARLLGDTLDDATAGRALDWCRREQIDCLYFLADADSTETVLAAEKHGFGLKDVRVTYHRRLDSSLGETLPALPPGVVIRPSWPGEANDLQALAAGNYTESRFYHDGRFPRAKVDEMYRVWVRQSVEGQANVVLVLESEGRARGFITCHLLDAKTGQCRLGGLDPALRGCGLGKQMYESALRWFAQHGVETVVYVTQARNIRAQRLFQRLGFLSHSTQLWYHKWFERGTAAQRAAA